VRDLEKIQEKKTFRLEGRGLLWFMLGTGLLAISAFVAGSMLTNSSFQSINPAVAPGSVDALKHALGQTAEVPRKDQMGELGRATLPAAPVLANAAAKNGNKMMEGMGEDEVLGAPAPTLIPTPPKKKQAPQITIIKKPTKVIKVQASAAPVTPENVEAQTAPRAEQVKQALYIPPPTPAGGPASGKSLGANVVQTKKPMRKVPLKRGIRSTKKAQKGEFTLQIRAFRTPKDATAFGEMLNDGGYNAYVVKSEIPEKGTWYRVRIGEFGTLKEATDFQEYFEGNEGISTFVSPL